MGHVFQALYVKYNKKLQLNTQNNFWRLLNQVVRTNCNHISERDYLLSLVKVRDLDSFYDYTERMAALQHGSPWQHYVYAQLHSLVKKNIDITLPGVNPRDVAINAFFDYDANLPNQLDLNRIQSELHHARGVITHVLGVDPNWNAILSECGFGPGASIGVHGNVTNVHRKMSARPSVTPSCLTYAFAGIMGIPSVADMYFESKHYQCSDGSINRIVCIDKQYAWTEYLRRVDIVDYKKVNFVPKTAKTHRVIAVEPLLNGFVQKGLDQFMRRKLLKIGVDLSDQDRNSHLAYLGSRDWNEEDPFVTIDLKSASDSITENLMKELFDPEWFAVFDRLRARSSIFEGKAVSLNQFVSMGNGFCFPLQSLIFASLAIASGAKVGDFHVYGDDIIVRKSVSRDLLPTLKSAGFVVNSQKTFVDGPFRESCGKDYHGGVNVRPLFLKRHIVRLEEVFKFLNSIKKEPFWGDFFQGIGFEFFFVPDDLRFVRPITGPDDAAVTVDLDTFLASKHSFGSSVIGNVRWRRLHFDSKIDVFQSPFRNYALEYVALSGGRSNRPFVSRYSLTPKMLIS